MALGFTSHYSSGENCFGSLTQAAYNSETDNSETTGQVSLFINSNGSCVDFSSGNGYDCCEFSTSVDIDYSQYAGCIAEGSSSETAGSIAFSSGSSASFSGGGVSFSGGGGGGGGCSCASFTC